MTRITLLLLIIILSVLVRFAYINYAGAAIRIEPDSQAYYTTGNFFTGDFIHNYFNTNRTPGYNIITSLVISASGYGHPPYLSGEFFRGSWYIIMLQTVVGVAGLFVLFDLLLAIGLPAGWSLAFTFFTGLNIYQFIWEHAFLSHALFITMVTIILRLFVALLHKPTAVTGGIFTAVSVAAFLVRPAGIAIPFLLLPFVWLRHKTKKVLFLVLTLLCIYTLAPLSHIIMNKSLYNFNGLSINNDFALFGRILHYHIPVDSASSVRPLYDQVVSYRARGGNISIPWYFFVYYNNEIYDQARELRQFDRLVLQKYWRPFAATMIGDIPRVFSDTNVSGVLHRSQAPGFAWLFFDSLARIFASIQKMSIVFLVLFPISLWLYAQKAMGCTPYSKNIF